MSQTSITSCMSCSTSTTAMSFVRELAQEPPNVVGLVSRPDPTRARRAAGPSARVASARPSSTSRARPVEQRVDARVGDVAEPDALDDARRRTAPGSRAAGAADVGGDAHVLAHREQAEQLEPLERAREPEPGPLDGRSLRDVAALDAAPAPLLGGSRPVITLNSVVLPAPFGPIEPGDEAGLRREATPSSATLPPKRTVTSRTSSAAHARRGPSPRRRTSGAHSCSSASVHARRRSSSSTSPGSQGSVTPTHSSGDARAPAAGARRACSAEPVDRGHAQEPRERPHDREDHERPVACTRRATRSSQIDELAADERGEDPLVAPRARRTRRACRRSRRSGCGRGRCPPGRAARPTRLAKNGPSGLSSGRPPPSERPENMPGADVAPMPPMTAASVKTGRPVMKLEVAGLDRLELARVQRAAEAGHAGRDREHRGLGADEAHAERRARRLAVLHREEPPTEGAAPDPHDEQRQQREHDRQQHHLARSRCRSCSRRASAAARSSEPVWNRFSVEQAEDRDRRQASRSSGRASTAKRRGREREVDAGEPQRGERDRARRPRRR